MLDVLRFRLWVFRDAMRDFVRGSAHRQSVFSAIYQANAWGEVESVSGSGSSAAATQAIRRDMPALFEQLGIRSLLDAPCGDFHWMQEVAGSLDRYVGVDIVPELIARNAERYTCPNLSFQTADITVDALPNTDAILCRDCFIHLPTRLIWQALHNFRSTTARYLLLTNDDGAGSYHDIPVGSFRPINFRLPPFSFRAPLYSLGDGGSSHRRLNVWRLQDLPGQ